MSCRGMSLYALFEKSLLSSRYQSDINFVSGLDWSCGGNLTTCSHRKEKFGSVKGERSWIDQNFCCVLSSACFMNFSISSPSSFILFLLTNNKLICQQITAPISRTIIARNILLFIKSFIFNRQKFHIIRGYINSCNNQGYGTNCWL